MEPETITTEAVVTTPEPVVTPTDSTGVTLDNLTQSPLENPIKQPLSNEADTHAINEELQELYEIVSKKIRLSVANNQFTAESLEVILSKIVETLQDISLAGGKHLTGIEKRNIGINILRLVMKDLHESGQISDELFSSFNIILTYAAPALFYAAKEAWKKINQVSDDIAQKGCSGCFKRNFC